MENTTSTHMTRWNLFANQSPNCHCPIPIEHLSPSFILSLWSSSTHKAATTSSTSTPPLTLRPPIWVLIHLYLYSTFLSFFSPKKIDRPTTFSRFFSPESQLGPLLLHLPLRGFFVLASLLPLLCGSAQLPEIQFLINFVGSSLIPQKGDSEFNPLYKIIIEPSLRVHDLDLCNDFSFLRSDFGMETLYPVPHVSGSDWFVPEMAIQGWTREENKQFETALAMYDKDTPDRWLKVAAMIPGKTVFDVLKQYEELLEDVCDIEAGRVPIPGYLASPFSLVDDRSCFDGCRKRSAAARGFDQERKKGVPWTQEEHRLFLMGLLKYGKGDWRNISRNFVVTKTPTQVASHAQKYFIRQHSGGKDKRRPSIHDITTVNLSSDSPKPPSILDDCNIFPQEEKPASLPKVVLEWNRPNDGSLVFKSSPLYDISSNGLGQNRFGGSYKSMFPIQSARQQIHG